MSESSQLEKWLLAGTLILAILLRFVKLGAESYWLDEAYSVGMVQQNSYTWLLFEHPTFDPHPPLHYILLKPWVTYVGWAPTATRLQSVLFGVATVAVVYYLGRELFEVRTGLYAALFVAITPLHIWYSQEIRMYALLAFLAGLSTLSLVWLTRQWDSRRIATYVLSTVALGYTHVFGLFVILAQGLFLLSRPILSGTELQLSYRRWLTVHGVVAILLAPWGYALVWRVFITDALTSDHLTWIQPPDPWIIVDILALFAGGAGLDSELDVAIPGGLPIGLTALAFVFVIGGLFRIELKSVRELDVSSEWNRLKDGVSIEDDNVPALWLLTLVLAVPIIVPFVLSVTLGPILVLRYTIPASLGFYLLVARGAGKIRPPPIQVTLVGLLVIGMMVPLPAYYTQDQKGQWDEAAIYVNTYADEDDLVIIAPSYAWWPWWFASDGVPDVRTGGWETTNATIREWIRGYDRVFLVFRFPGQETRERFQAVVDESPRRDLAETRSFIFVTVHRYGNDTAPGTSLPAHLPT